MSCSLFVVSPFATLNEMYINRTYNLGETAILECNSTGGPGNTYVWQKDGRDQLGENSTILTLHNVMASTGGIYSCVASNAAGNHSASTLTYIFPYFIVQPVKAVFTSNGSMINLSCVAMAFPESEYQWGREDGRDIRSDITVNMSVLTFSSIQFGDEGSYYCNATSNGHVINSESVLITGELLSVCIMCIC